jgi:hypothetical protein
MLQNLTTIFYQSLSAFAEAFMGGLPSVLGAIVVLVLGWLISKGTASLLDKILLGLKFDVLATKLKVVELLDRGNIKSLPSKIISQFVYWVLLLLVFITASDILGWHSVSEGISKLISYLPALFSAVILFILGSFIAGFVRDIIRNTTASLGLRSGRFLSQFIFYLLMIIITLTALNQAGIDTTIITSNLLLILGAMLASLSISYGFASRDILTNILAIFFSRRTFYEGQVVEIDGIRGEIVQIESISIIIKDQNNEKIVIPAHEFVTKKVKIID